MKFWLIAIPLAFLVSWLCRIFMRVVTVGINIGITAAEKLYPCHAVGLEHHWVDYCPKNACHCDCGQKCNECLRVCIKCRTIAVPVGNPERIKLTKEDWNNIIAASIHES